MLHFKPEFKGQLALFQPPILENRLSEFPVARFDAEPDVEREDKHVCDGEQHTPAEPLTG